MFVLLKYNHDSEISPAFSLCRKSPYEPSDKILFTLTCHSFTIFFLESHAAHLLVESSVSKLLLRFISV